MMKVKREIQGWAPTDIEWNVYREWEDHKKYPYDGGYLSQPEWFFELRRKCELLEELVRLNSGLREKKD